METETDSEVLVQLGDRIECSCGRIITIGEMRYEKDQTFPKPVGGVDETGYFFCQCDSQNPKVYRRDSDTLVLSDPNITRIL